VHFVLELLILTFGLFSVITTIMPKIYPEDVKLHASELRKQGYSYSEIQTLINLDIPKNTFTGWFKNILLTEEAQARIRKRIRDGGAPGRAISWQNRQNRRRERLKNIYEKAYQEIPEIDVTTAKICLAMLYLGDGSKTIEGVRFGNSDAKIIKLFLFLLRQSFVVDERRLRGRLQCRADQNIQNLQIFWSKLSGIQVSQFHKAQIDKRTIGIPTLRADYKGVFVVEYASGDAFLELKFISDIIYQRALPLGL
jgi:hypothetical protein